MVDYSRL